MPEPHPFYASLSVALGGGTGALLRYQLGRSLTRLLGPAMVMAFPWATLAANAIGSVAMGLLAGFLARHGTGSTLGGIANGEQMRLLLGVGLLGGFTTFSAFSLELVLLVERGQVLFALLYLILSIGLGVTGLVFGLTVMRLVA